MRLALAVAVLAVAWSAAVYVHQRRTHPAPKDPIGKTFSPLQRASEHPSWEDPAAVLIAIGGVAVAVGIACPRRLS